MSISKKTAKSSGKMRSDAGAAWGFLSPWIIGFLIFSAFPLAFSFYLSLTKWNLMGDPQFVGLQNYKDMLSGNGELGQTLLATAIFTVINVSVSILFSLLLAILLNFKVRFKRTVPVLLLRTDHHAVRGHGGMLGSDVQPAAGHHQLCTEIDGCAESSELVR